jgi:ribosomal protein S18 acetylase RimI-like enzyme
MEPRVTVRCVTAADTDAIVALWNLVFAEYRDASRPHRDPRANIARKLAFGDDLFFLAEVDRRPVGTLMAGYDGHRGWLYSLAVDPAHRRRGIARALLTRAEDALRARGCPKVNLQVAAANAGALAFWRHAGYLEDEVASFGRAL